MLRSGNPEICSIHLFNLINNCIATTLKEAYYVRFETSKRIIKVLTNISDYGITIMKN